MNSVNLIDIAPDFYAFLCQKNNRNELVISAHGWQNKIRRNGELINAQQLDRIINAWRVSYHTLIVASCSSTYLPSSGLFNRLGHDASEIYKETLGCELSRYKPGVIVRSFIGEVHSSVDNPHAWGLYNSLGKDGLEFMIGQLFHIKYDATVSGNIHNPCRYVEFQDGKPVNQKFPTTVINNRRFGHL
ncbi:hypothetical protein FKD06_23815 [Serratia sp. SRS-8-S-2018]|uniref:hypothetical protein n=1 Tax=Serratia sp. SRS-8-S-2018 TaxID=2591107 RepID=UPI0011401BB8|nr:hypothetical protein [Serratia sp. SRS-8-S-2018]TPW42155.1 hypothetical protein FKD06_23815 [Serratia sp. SRS-8-S-2018]